MEALQELDALLEGVYARAGDVAAAPEPEKLLRELLEPVRVLFISQGGDRGKSLSISSDLVAQVNGDEEELPDLSKKHNYLSGAATKIQALLGANANGASGHSRVSNIRHSIAVPRMSKLNFDSAKMPRAQNVFSGAANKIHAVFNKGGRTGSVPSVPATAVANKRVAIDDRSEAAVRIQALVRGKQERVSIMRQHSFLEQGTKVLKKYVMKSDRFPNSHVLSTPHGFIAPNFRRVEGTPLYGSAQPSVRGIQMILDQVAEDGFTKVVWINLREEAVIYVDGQPFTARRSAKLNENDLVPGITGHKVQVLETSMKNSLQEQLAKANDTFLYWNEFTLNENDLVSCKVNPDKVLTLPEVYESPAIVNSNSLIKSVTYRRIPIERENAPESSDFEAIVELIRSSIANDSDTAFVFNCQMGKRRTTTALVLCSLLWQRANVTPETFPADLKQVLENEQPGSHGNFAVIRAVQQRLEFGPQAKWWVDKVIDESSAICNIREVITEYHDKSNAEAKPARRSYFLHHAMSFLERYFYIVVFGAYLLSTHPPRLPSPSGEEGNAPAESSTPPTFSKWLRQHPNLFRLLDDLGGVRYKSDKVLENCVVKMDHFFGIAKLPFSLTDNVLNYRRIGDKPIFGTAQCLELGIRDVITSLQGEFDRAIWINLREEAVIYVSGRPFVMRHREKLLDNVEYPGIEVDEITAIEAQVKREIQGEVRKANGLFMYWYEPREFESEETMEHINPDSEIKTLVEVYDKVASSTGFELRYARVPVSDETAPEEKDLDDMLRLIVPAFMTEMGLALPGQPAPSSVERAKTAVICNCQMGRGRTTTALVCVYMLRVVLEGTGADSPASASTERRQSIAAAADYVVIRKLMATLENGLASKQLVDYAIDQCEHMQNLRECIAQCRDQAMDASLPNSKRDFFMLRAVNYLERYFYLICFASYLLEERDHFYRRTRFVAWMNDRYGSALYELLDNLCFEEDPGAETHASSMRWRWRRKRKLVSRLE